VRLRRVLSRIRGGGYEMTTYAPPTAAERREDDRRCLAFYRQQLNWQEGECARTRRAIAIVEEKLAELAR
jgi:predicted ATP-dependent protease